jgi:hypothetical protein
MSSTSMYQHRADRLLQVSKQQDLPVKPQFETDKKADIKLVPPYISQAVEVISICTATGFLPMWPPATPILLSLTSTRN